jgi:hypothetical protein
MVSLQAEITTYKWDSFCDAFKAIGKWVEKDMINEEEAMRFTMEMYNQIPDRDFNDIQDRL